MSQIARVGDKTTGHGGFGPQDILAGSGDVKVDGIPAARVGDSVSSHSDGNSSHDSVIAGGSGTVRVNGKALARVGDAIACGGSVASGSGTCNAG